MRTIKDVLRVMEITWNLDWKGLSNAEKISIGRKAIIDFFGTKNIIIVKTRPMTLNIFNGDDWSMPKRINYLLRILETSLGIPIEQDILEHIINICIENGEMLLLSEDERDAYLLMHRISR